MLFTVIGYNEADMFAGHFMAFFWFGF